MFRRSHPDFYSLLCHVKCPYQLTPSRTFMWLRWLNKNAVRGADPDLWPHRNVHTNVSPITSFLLRATNCLNKSSCWQIIHQPHQTREQGGEERLKTNGGTPVGHDVNAFNEPIQPEVPLYCKLFRHFVSIRRDLYIFTFVYHLHFGSNDNRITIFKRIWIILHHGCIMPNEFRLHGGGVHWSNSWAERGHAR